VYQVFLKIQAFSKSFSAGMAAKLKFGVLSGLKRPIPENGFL
jgi:hypothetical protein